MSNEVMVTITQEEYNELLEDSWFLECLECAGVDNWDGYSYATEMFNSDEGE
jgi:hypothetical protein